MPGPECENCKVIGRVCRFLSFTGCFLLPQAVPTKTPRFERAKVASNAVSQPAAVQSLQELESAVLEIIQELVGSAVSPDAPLAAQGLDSLASMELRQKLQARVYLPCNTVSSVQYQSESARLVFLAHKTRTRQTTGLRGFPNA